MIKFVGDICLSDNDFDVGFGVGSKVAKGFNPFANIKKNEGELWVGNLECVLSDSTTRKGYNKTCFRSTPTTLTIDNLFDCYGVSNNHIMQHGSDAYKETLETVSHNGKDYVGSKDRKTIILSNGGKTVAITSFSLRCDNTGLESDYWYAPEWSEIKEECLKYNWCDYKIAYIHWGVEFVPYPYSDQQKMAHRLIDIGYDLIIGHHPHVLQGYEVYKGKSIFYSLGNFVFNMAYPDSKVGLIVSLDPHTANVSMDYVLIGKDYSPVIVQESDIPNHLRLDHLNSQIGLFPNIEQYGRESVAYLKRYRRSHHAQIIKNSFRYAPSFLWGMIMNYLHERLHR